MPAYRTIVVGTDGSATSFAAVERAAGVAADSGAQLVIVSAYTPASREDTSAAEDALKDEAYLVTGWTPAEEALREASDRAQKVGRVEGQHARRGRRAGRRAAQGRQGPRGRPARRRQQGPQHVVRTAARLGALGRDPARRHRRARRAHQLSRAGGRPAGPVRRLVRRSTGRTWTGRSSTSTSSARRASSPAPRSSNSRARTARRPTASGGRSGSPTPVRTSGCSPAPTSRPPGSSRA